MSNYASQAYKMVGVNTAVDSASPHKLILMLYDGLLRQVRLAKAHMQKGDLGAKAACLSKAISILDQGLRAALDDEKGGELAVRLRALYDYCERQLVHANARNDAAVIDEVIALIEPLRTAWNGIGPEVERLQETQPRGATR
jgi:flagellar protein FliS